MNVIREKRRDLLIVIDMQNDFISGPLAAPEAETIIPAVIDQIKKFTGDILFTMDTHGDDYLETNEGQHLPVEHCIKGSWGWQLDSRVAAWTKGHTILEKPTFGSLELGRILVQLDEKQGLASVTLIGLVTDICVISNAIIAKAALPHTEVIVDAKATAGTTATAKTRALAALEGLHVVIKD